MARGAAPALNPEALRDSRLAAGLSQAALARAAGTDRRQIIRYENGSERPEIGRLSALARACSVTVADLVDDDALPPGLAGLRIGAGLTMAAAAAALAEHIDPATGIATNRASLSYAEKGRLPLSWRPAPAGSRVRGAMAATYEVDIDQVRTAWQATFPRAPRRPPAPHKGAGPQVGGGAGFINATSDEAVDEAITQTPPPVGEGRPSPWRPLSAWLWERLAQVAAAGPAGADDEWTGGARWQEHLATRERPRGTTGRGYVDDDTAGRYWLTEAGRAHIIAHREDYADLYPQVRQPRAVREMDANTLLRAPDPDAYTAHQVWGSARPASQRWTIRAKVRTLSGGIIDAAAHGVEGHVPSVRWQRDDRTGGVRAPRVDEVVEVLEWSSPWRSMPEAAPDLPGARRAPEVGSVELPFIDQAPPWMRELPVCPYSPAELAAYRLKTVGDGLYEVRVDHTAQGRVRRDGPSRWSFAALDPQTGQPRSYVPVIAKRPTRTRAVEALLSTPGPLWSRPMPTFDDDWELPNDEPTQEPASLELLSQQETDAFEVGACRMYRVLQSERLVGFVWRDADSLLWCGASANPDGSLGLVAVITPRDGRTRQSVVEHLLDPNAAYIRGESRPTNEGQEQADTDQIPGVAVLVSGNPDSARPYLRVEVDGDTIGQLEDLHTWNRQRGWAFYPQLTVQEQRAMTRIELGGRPPAATTTETDIVAAVRELLPQVMEQTVRIDSLHGRHTGLVGLNLQHMEDWELHRGRVSGREDVYARGRCWGWLQPATGGRRTAHTTTGPVPGGPWADREDAVAALWAHLTAPLPPPRLGEQTRAKRRIRAPRDARPLCPYSEVELARVRLIRDRPEDQHSPYRAESPVDHRVLGYVWRKDARRWAYAAATGRTPEYSPALPTAPTRAAALEALLAQPGPLWADPDSAIIH